jgi:Cytochrome c554 and c-prime
MVRATDRQMSGAVRGGIAGLVACVVAYAAHAASLPYQSKDQHLGVASCASSLCHGSVTPNANYNVLLNEFITWSHQDAHAKAFQALTSERGRSIAGKLGLPLAEGAKECLDCHADNVAPAQRGAKFALVDGVGCEACHGGAERWIASHATAKATYQGDVSQGMYPSANLGERAQLCESCHVGNADKQATHTIMGAGHPRLSFELDTYLALEPPHYAADANYRRRKPAFNHAQTWAAGQLQASALQLDLLQGPLLRGGGVFPELALFNCSACHDSSMQRLEWRRRAMTQLTNPGMVPLNDAYWRMSWIIARAIDPDEGARVLTQAQMLQRAVLGGREQLAAQARELGTVLRRLQQRAAGEAWSASRTSNVLESILQAGSDGEFRDYLGAEQAVMATELLLIEKGQASRLRPQLDELYRLVKDVDAYRSADFIAKLRDLRAAL